MGGKGGIGRIGGHSSNGPAHPAVGPILPVCRRTYTDPMRAIVVALLVAVPLSAQTRKPPARKPAPPAVPLTKVVPEVTCPTPLGVGSRPRSASARSWPAGIRPAGCSIQIPPHKGPATLTFDLHNLHLYSEEQVRAKRGFARYTATIGVLTMDNTLISRAVVAERVPNGGRPGRPRRRRRRSWRRQSGRADRHRVDRDRRFPKAKSR